MTEICYKKALEKRAPAGPKTKADPPAPRGHPEKGFANLNAVVRSADIIAAPFNFFLR
jgi:hypothetical protein